MISTTIHAAKANLSRLIAVAQAGEEVVIMRGANPVVKLVAISPDAQRPRAFGALAGQVTVGPEFADSLPDTEVGRWDR